MGLKSTFKKIRDDYVVYQVKNATFPEFGESPVERWRITFSGRVQKIGFRLEVCELAKRLGLTGFCKNLDNGKVLAEFQGPVEKIEYLAAFMESLRRIKITDKVVAKLEVKPKEQEFVQRH